MASRLGISTPRRNFGRRGPCPAVLLAAGGAARISTVSSPKAVGELRTRLGGLPSPAEAEDIWGDIWFQEAHNSTAIEGNTLDLREVEILLGEGRAVGDKQLAEYLEVRGYADAARWVYQQGLDPGEWTAGELLSITEVRHVHRLAMTKVWDVTPHPDAGPSQTPGAFRQHGIEPFPGGMQPPDWPEVPALMTDWIANASAVVPAVAGSVRLVPLAALSDDRLSARALRTAAERGRLRAQRDARGQWRSSRNWVDEHRASRYQRPH